MRWSEEEINNQLKYESRQKRKKKRENRKPKKNFYVNSFLFVKRLKIFLICMKKIEKSNINIHKNISNHIIQVFPEFIAEYVHIFFHDLRTRNSNRKKEECDRNYLT